LGLISGVILVKIVKCLFLLLIFVLVLAACTQVPREGGYIQIFGYNEPVPPIVSIENEYLTLEFLTDSAQIIVTERATGNVWRSTPENATNIPGASAISVFHMQSLFILEYEDIHGRSVPQDAYRSSVRNNRFEHAIVDGALELYFTIGDIPEVFFIPDAIYEERLEYFTAQMEVAQRRQVTEAYRLLRSDRLRPADDRAALYEQFPTLQEGAHIFVLRDTVHPHVLSRIEGYLQGVGYDLDEWVYDMSYFGVVTNLDLPSFNLTMRFELDANSMAVSVPLSEITYNPSYLPTRITLMPFFGAGYVEDDGYLFVPDGSGALMHFGSGRGNQGIYFNNIFGWDEAILRDALNHDNRAAYPVFGVHRGDTTFVGIVEEGASYGSIRAEMSGFLSPYSAVHPTFRLIQSAPMDVAGRSDRPFSVFEQDLARDENIVVRYVFTQQQGYVGMAVAYREFLQARYPWLNQRLTQPVHAMVEILGAAETRQHILGVPVDRPYALTTFDQAADMMVTFDEFGWENIHIKMRGAHNDSIDHSVPTSLNLVSQLGNRRAFNNMLDTAEGLGFEFYLEGDFVHMRGNSMFNGFRNNRDAARQVNRQRVTHTGFSHVYFGLLGTGNILANPSTLARPAYTVSLVENFVSEASNIGVNNIAFRSLASSLAGDFHEDRHVTREASMHMRAALLAGLRDQGTGIWLNYGFSYAMPFADIITSMPVTDQGFGVTSASIPFYQIALHGLVHFAPRPLNLAEDHSYYLLRSIESGSSLFFSFMSVPTAELEVTRYRRYFANEFDRWANVANNLYQNHVANFDHLYNQLIVDHQILADGVSVTVYEDGTRVYVNVSIMDYDGDVFVPSRRYVVVR